jgi:hypothetical protein
MCDMKKTDKAEYRRLLDEIGEDYCPEGKYCIFKEFIISAHPSRRLLVQLKCMDKFKLLRSRDAGNDIGWETTMRVWVDEGHAEKFSKHYGDDKKVNAIFDEMFPKKG